jgi:hypothetical protein
MIYENRIIGSGEEKLDQILFNPKNWRKHPKYQQEALQGVLEKIGWVQQVIINKRTGCLVDGHLRVQLAAREGNETIPVLYIDISEEEEDLVLASLDPIGKMAETDKEKLAELHSGIETDSERIKNFLEQSARDEKILRGEEGDGNLLNVVDITIEDPKTKVNHNDVFRIGEHILVCANIMDEWEFWSQYLEAGMLFVPYPGMYAILVKKYRRMLLVQPDEYIAGHIVDRYIEIYGEAEVEQL